jgi:hypothetical protein
MELVRLYSMRELLMVLELVVVMLQRQALIMMMGEEMVLVMFQQMAYRMMTMTMGEIILME